jgi:hypothetical protein
MSTFNKIPRHIEEVLSSRRDFLKTSGLFAVTMGAAAAGVAPFLMERGRRCITSGCRTLPGSGLPPIGFLDRYP